MNLTNQYQYPWPVTEILKAVTLPLPSTGEQISVAAEGETKAERDILNTVLSLKKKAEGLMQGQCLEMELWQPT